MINWVCYMALQLSCTSKSVSKFCNFVLTSESELHRLEAESVISTAHFLDWAAPIVPVAKRDGSVCTCGEYKITLNKVLKSEVYPLLRIEEMFTTLAGGLKFTKLDLSHT